MTRRTTHLGRLALAFVCCCERFGAHRCAVQHNGPVAKPVIQAPLVRNHTPCGEHVTHYEYQYRHVVVCASQYTQPSTRSRCTHADACHVLLSYCCCRTYCKTKLGACIIHAEAPKPSSPHKASGALRAPKSRTKTRPRKANSTNYKNLNKPANKKCHAATAHYSQEQLLCASLCLCKLESYTR